MYLQLCISKKRKCCNINDCSKAQCIDPNQINPNNNNLNNDTNNTNNNNLLPDPNTNNNNNNITPDPNTNNTTSNQNITKITQNACLQLQPVTCPFSGDIMAPKYNVFANQSNTYNYKNNANPRVPMKSAYEWMEDITKKTTENIIKRVGEFQAKQIGIHHPFNSPSFKKEDWDSTEWDCKTTLPNPCYKDGVKDAWKPQVEWVFPKKILRGVLQLYEAKKPFCDPDNPTVYEIEQWNLEVIRHLRKVMGITTPVVYMKELFVKSRLSDEKKFSSYWNEGVMCNPDKYWGDFNNPTETPHCGFGFIPKDQTKYEKYFDGQPKTTTNSMSAEGIFGFSLEEPWSTKLMTIIYNTMISEGYCGHSGNFTFSEKIGMTWALHSDNSTLLRVQQYFSGRDKFCPDSCK